MPTQMTKISDILQYLRNARWQLPEFQRTYVWNEKRVSSYFDSLYKEYPTGSILISDSADLVFRNLEGQKVVHNTRPISIVLDGQQRLTSLLRVSNGDVDLYFDVENKMFTTRRHRRSLPYLFPVAEILLDKDSVVERMRELLKPSADKRKEYTQALDSVSRILDYSYYVHEFNGEPKAVSEAYIRINNGGKPLTGTQLMLSTLALGASKLIAHDFRDARAEFAGLGFSVPLEFMAKTYAAVAVHDVKFRSAERKLKNLSEKQLRSAFKECRNGILRVLHVLKDVLNLDSLDVLPSANVLVPAVAYCAKLGKALSADEKEKISKWIIRATISARYGKSADSTLNKDLIKVHRAREHCPVSQYIDQNYQCEGRTCAAINPEGTTTQ
jgi:hypothetical protein